MQKYPSLRSVNSPLQGYLTTRHKAVSVVRPIQCLAFLDPLAAQDMWISAFSAAWECLSRREEADLTVHMINLLSKDYYIKQAEMRPNVIQTLLSGILARNPPMILPPNLVKFLCKTWTPVEEPNMHTQE